MTDIMKVGDTLNANDMMSSLEIAELTGKQHAHVMRDIRSLLEQGVAESNFGLGSYSDANGQERPCYYLTKKGCLILASGYDAKLREKIIDRWEELELTPKVNIPQTFAEALRLAADKLEENERLQLEIKEQAPKVEYYDELVDRSKSFNFRDTAKLLGVKESLFIYFLLDKGYIYRDTKKRLLPIAEYNGKYFETKEFVHGSHNGIQTLVTQRGREHFLKLTNHLKSL